MPPVLCRVKRLPGTASREEFQAYLQSLAQGRGVEVIEWNHGTALLRCPSKKAKDRLNQAFRSTPFKTVKLVAEKLPPTSSSAAAGGDGDETQSHPTQDIRKVAFAGEGCTCRVGGIKKSLRGEFEKYLSTKVETDLLLVKFLQHKKTLSAILRVENEEAVRRLNAEFQEKLFAKAARVAHIVPTDSLTHTDTWVALDTPEEQAYVEAKGLAKGFHEYLVDRPDLLEQAADRDRLGEIFHLFYSGPEKMQGRKMESYVLARMREMKLLKSKRVGDQVVVLIANRDKTFPTLGEKKDFVADQRRLAGENKGGVEVSGVEIDFAQVDEKTELPFDVSSNDPTVVLTALNLSGAKPKAFQLASIALPTPLNKSLRVPLIFHPKNIGCYHAILDFVFESSSETFSIKRFLTLRAGNKVLDAILKPESPFKRRVPHVYSKKFSEVIDAPSSGHKSDKNPFKKLPQFTVPPQIKSLLMNHEFEGAIKRPVDSCGYGDFWKKMLWASELQAFQDIQLFDMEDTSLKREGRFFSLTVPGLAEGRPSVLRGDLVHVTWNNRLYKGRVQSTRLLEVILEFDRAFEKFNPGLDRVDVRFTFSRMTYRTSHHGCFEAENILKDRLLYPGQSHVDNSRHEIGPREVSLPLKWANRFLNEEQHTAIESIVKGSLRPLPYIIFGPPGTGKTTTVVEAVYQLAMQKQRILLVAPSNDAADILVERLSSYFPPTEMRRLLAYSRSVDTLPDQIQNYAREGADSEQQLAEIMSARIVVSTVNLSARFAYFKVPRGHFDVLCVDEAGHATEPEVVSVVASLMDFSGTERMGQVILAGDPKQLGPVISSVACQKLGMSVSYMERLALRNIYQRGEDGKYHPELLTKLVKNYRSHPSIIELPNKMFYDGDLQCFGDPIATMNMAQWEHLPCKGFPIIFHSLEGSNLREGNSPSWFNPEEAQQVVEYAKKLLFDTRPALQQDEIGVITPYARQAQKIRLALKAEGITEIKVGSVETFQGQERRCIIVSTVRSQQSQLAHDQKYNLGFVSNEKRFNVAITRAKTLLIVIGCAKVLATDRNNWAPFLTYCHKNGGWAGDEFNQEELGIEEDDSVPDVDDGWDLLMGAPSHKAEQEAFGFVGQEE